MKTIAAPFICLVLCACLALSLGACGQRGPLYLPDEEPVPQNASAEAEAEENPAEEEQQEEQQEEDEESPRA